MPGQYTLYSHRGPGPNPLKAAVLMEHLGISYDVIPLDFGDDSEKGVKGAKFLKINPNGRVPCLVSNDSEKFSVWESGAILYYLCDKHDAEGRFLGKNPEERAIVMQFLTFQLSGLGPTQVSRTGLYRLSTSIRRSARGTDALVESFTAKISATVHPQSSCPVFILNVWLIPLSHGSFAFSRPGQRQLFVSLLARCVRREASKVCLHPIRGRNRASLSSA